MTATHDTTIQIQILLDAPPAGVSGFVPLILGDQEEGTTLDGDRVRTYTSAADVDADETAGYLSGFVADAVRRGFSQSPRPAAIKVGRVDTDGGGEGYDDALSEIELVDGDFYAIALDSRLPADQLEVAAWCEARDKLAFLQSGDADWLTAGIPTDYSAIEDNENTVVLYHDNDARSEEFSWACNRLAFSPDTFSVPFECALGASLSYTDPINPTQKGFAEENNANLLLPFGNAAHYVANNGVGVNLAGRQIAERLTKHWFKRRLAENVAQTKLTYTARGEKIPVSLEGSAVMQAVVESLFEVGEEAGHFLQTVAEFPTPTSADIEAARIRGGGSAQLSTSAGTFDFVFLFTRQPVIEESE